MPAGRETAGGEQAVGDGLGVHVGEVVVGEVVDEGCGRRHVACGFRRIVLAVGGRGRAHGCSSLAGECRYEFLGGGDDLAMAQLEGAAAIRCATRRRRALSASGVSLERGRA